MGSWISLSKILHLFVLLTGFFFRCLGQHLVQTLSMGKSGVNQAIVMLVTHVPIAIPERNNSFIRKSTRVPSAMMCNSRDIVQEECFVHLHTLNVSILFKHGFSQQYHMIEKIRVGVDLFGSCGTLCRYM